MSGTNQARENGGLLAPPPLDVYYMRMLADQADARLGKLSPGQIVALDRAKATRWLTVGIAEQVSRADFDSQQDRKREKTTARQNAFSNLNDAHAMWDVSTYRDVLTASEQGLRLAWERGIPLVNVHMLRDEDGDPIPPDADIEEILECRQLLHADAVAPFAAHDRSSVMGGGSPYVSNLPSGPMPLNPAYRAQAERVMENDRFAQIPQALRLDANRGEPMPPGSARNAMRRQQRLHPSQQNQPAESGEMGWGATPPPMPPTPPTPPGISPEAARQASIYDVPPPQQATPPQVANAPEEDDEVLDVSGEDEDPAPPPPPSNKGKGKNKDS